MRKIRHEHHSLSTLPFGGGRTAASIGYILLFTIGNSNSRFDAHVLMELMAHDVGFEAVAFAE